METEVLLKWQAFRDEVCNMLNPGGQIADDANLLHMGLSSIEMMKLINVSKKLGYRLTFEQLVKKPYLKDWRQLLLEESISEEQFPHMQNQKYVDMYEPFPLSEV